MMDYPLGEPTSPDCHVKPDRIRVDKGPEFISKDLDLWAYANKVILDFFRPGHGNIMRGKLFVKLSLSLHTKRLILTQDHLNNCRKRNPET